ncbi:MAG TPA: hypothetical protein VH000_06390, partial [Rhizomicrobium sp.]|nr:hypothetical protein [Rhizomicrobium sp.]
MTRLFAILAIGLLTSTALADEQPYCSSFFSAYCFGSTDIAKQVITSPADFSIDEIDLPGGAHVTLYAGLGLSEQDDVIDLMPTKIFNAEAGDIKIVTGHSTHGLYFDVHFSEHGRWGVLQIFGYIKDANEAKSIGKFVASLHSCKHDNLNL